MAKNEDQTFEAEVAPSEAPAEVAEETGVVGNVADVGIGVSVADLPFVGVDPNSVRVPATVCDQPFTAEA